VRPTEAKLAEIWCDVLEIPEVDRQDNFFTVGGDSLLVAKVVRHIRRIWPIAVTVRDLFERPELAELAHWIDQRTAGAPEESRAGRG
jgi:aryl carrier-like protein